MPVNYTRRHDLFLDAGFEDPKQALNLLYEDAEQLGLLNPNKEATLALDESMTRAAQRVDKMLSPPVRKLLDSAPEFLFNRSGDLANLLWLARTIDVSSNDSADANTDDTFHLGAFVFGLAARMWQRGLHRETAAMIRFLVAVDFDYGALYQEPGIAYGFFQSRDPNPLAWKLLHFIDDRESARNPSHNTNRKPLDKIHALELGCGIGNDALGLMSGHRAASYVGCDLSSIALAEHARRAAPLLAEKPELSHTLIEGDFVSTLRKRDDKNLQNINLIYSYSSLHYFSSTELTEIFSLVHDALEPGVGIFAFAIKGKGSIWDGEGTPLYRPDVWINYDGQTRWFPSEKSIATMMDNHGFEMLLHEWHEHWGYSKHGERDLFHYVICTPRAS